MPPDFSLDHPYLLLTAALRRESAKGRTIRAMQRARWVLIAVLIAVLICVAVALGFALILSRRSVERARLQDLGHQADLIAAAHRPADSSLKSLQPRVQAILNKSPQHEIFLYKRRDLPVWAQARLAAHQPVQGTMNFGGDSYYFAARSLNPGTLVLLQPR